MPLMFPGGSISVYQTNNSHRRWCTSSYREPRLEWLCRSAQMTAPFGHIYSVAIVVWGNKNNYYTLPANLRIWGKVVSMWPSGQTAVVFFLNYACRASACYVMSASRKRNKRIRKQSNKQIRATAEIEDWVNYSSYAWHLEIRMLLLSFPNTPGLSITLEDRFEVERSGKPGRYKQNNTEGHQVAATNQILLYTWLSLFMSKILHNK